MGDRVILHCDLNCFFASVELLSHPDLRDIPTAVCGDPASRHGIILAKNEPAKRLGIQTAETIWQAKKKCPGLVLLPPHHGLYREYSRRVNAIYEQYTDLVEPFGIDESWLDITGSLHLFGGDAKALADEIRPQSLDEVVGQRHILGENGLLRRIIESGHIPNLVFYGPSGTGKTTVANIIARRTNRPLHRLNATTASISDIKDIIKDIEVGLAKTDGTYLVIPDRREAIFYAIRNAEEGDMIAIIGKGHEDYQEIEGVKHHFLDREVVEEAVNNV